MASREENILAKLRRDASWVHFAKKNTLEKYSLVKYTLGEPKKKTEKVGILDHPADPPLPVIWSKKKGKKINVYFAF